MTLAPPAPDKRSGRSAVRGIDPQAVIVAAFPLRSGEFRRIHRIAETEYYRVNFHRVVDNTIARSYFVICEGNKAEVANVE